MEDSTISSNFSQFSYNSSHNDTQVNQVFLPLTESPLENITMDISTSVPSSVLQAATTTPSFIDTTQSTLIVTQATTSSSSSSFGQLILNLTTEATPFPYELEPPMDQIPQNETSNVKTYHPEPGMIEFLVICGLIGIMLYIAAKYVGCKLSYFCCTCGESKSANELSGAREARYMRSENVFQRPEYERTLQYAVYTRPVTARIGSHIDPRGYGYSAEDEEEDQVEFYSRPRDKNTNNTTTGTDLPPDYDSLVPPSYNTNYNYFTFNSGNNTTSAIPRPATANPFLADSRL